MIPRAKTLETLLGPLEIPIDYPAQQHLALYRVMDEFFMRVETDERIRREHGLAMNAIVYRYCSVTDACDFFSLSITKHGDAPTQPIRYQQERSFFEFVVTGIAVLDSFAYLAFAIGAAFAPTEFPFAEVTERRKVNLKNTSETYRKVPNVEIANAIASVTSSDDYKHWLKFRNVLAHRGQPGRNIALALGSADPADIAPSRYKSFDDVEGPELTASSVLAMRSWLSAQLTNLMELLVDVAIAGCRNT